MHLKTLTLRGFKSFASATVLEFEPGVTCVVGPNGSGKSNVVDALAWVMGEQGAKSLRGGKMDDVIFAGTSGRPPLGRAEVSLTIDNADGALPIEYSEVTISRTLFRSGGSEYAINGTSCRLLDIQELLSDSGLGREMHVIVGQGQLDAILRATPEERRGFIEEAAGILKHRRRKEKALRKLDSTQANLTRVSDLISEIRRQLGPLGRQAEVARQAQQIQVDVRDSRSRLLADDLSRLTNKLAQDQADDEALITRRTEVEKALATAREKLAEVERIAAEATPELTRANDIYYRLSSIRERLRSLATLAEERLRILGSQIDPTPPTDLVDLDEQVKRAHDSRTELDAEALQAGAQLTQAAEVLAQAEQAAQKSELHLANLLRSVADRREGVARLAGSVAAHRSRVESAEAEMGRLRDSLATVQQRFEQATTEFTVLETTVVSAEEGEEDLDREYEAATEVWESVKTEITTLKERLNDAARERDSWSARMGALELSLERKDGAGALLGGGSGLVRGSLAALISVSPDERDAIAVALGAHAEALVVDSVGQAVDAIRWLRDEDAGRARFIVATERSIDVELSLPDGAIWAIDAITASADVRAALAEVLHNVAVTDDLAAARSLVEKLPQVSVVTRRGDLVSNRVAVGGAGSAPSVIELQSALAEARTQHQNAVALHEETSFALRGAQSREEEAKQRYDIALDRLNESDARLAAVAEQLGQWGAKARSAKEESERLNRQIEQAHIRLDQDQQELSSLVERLSAAQAEPEQTDNDIAQAQLQRDADSEQVTQARSAETEKRLALRTVEERARAASSRVEALERAREAERDARARAEVAAQKRERQAVAAQQVIAGAQFALSRIDVSVQQADDARVQVEEQRASRTSELAELRRQVESWGSEYSRLTNDAHRDEIARAELRVRIEQLEQRSIDELGVEPGVLIEEFGPHQPVPVLGSDETVPYEREVQEKRLRTAERSLSQLGKVNPLALEEYAALEERHKFLNEQQNDIKRSREDLLEIVQEIDERVRTVFEQAYNDTAHHFEQVFPRLFPGGEGRMFLTDPKNLLETGIEVEARPAGKKVKRLSLLSGGERSLTAVAFLVSLFKARPSPFYVMDEVEAALDDTNLGRLLDIIEELRSDSQLIVITHQKRTMEIADALYGVSMRGDGVTTVISQRLRERED